MLLATVVSFFTTQPESPLQAFKKEYMNALLEENARLLAACAEARADLSAAYGQGERPSPEYEAKRSLAERRTGVTLTKFFGE